MKNLKTLLVMIMVLFLSQPLWADQALVNKALDAFNKKDYKAANSIIDQHLANNPTDSDAFYSKGCILVKMGELRKALNAFAKTIELSPKNHKAYQQYGAILQRMAYHLINNGKIDDAIKAVDDAVSLVPDNPEYYRLNKEMRSGLAQIYFGRGAVYYELWCQTGDKNAQATALDSWKRAIDMEPISATQQLLLGVYAMNSMNYDTALTQFTAASTLREKNRYAILWKALAEASVGTVDLSSIIASLNQVEPLFVANPSFKLTLGNIYKANKQYDEAKTQILAARELSPNDRDINSSLKELFLITNDARGGIEIYNQAVSAEPASYANRYRLAAFLHQSGNYNEAIKAYDQAIRIGSAAQKAEARMEKAIIMLEKAPLSETPSESALEQVFPSSDRAIAAKGGNPRYQIFEGYMGATNDKREAAIRAALKDVGPDSLWLHSEAFTAWAQLETGRAQHLRALEMVYQAWRRTPSGSPALAKLKELFAIDKEAALKALNNEMRTASKSRGTKSQERAAALRGSISTVSALTLQTPGELFNQLPGARQTTDSTLVPATVDANLPHVITTASAPITWGKILPPWEKEREAE